VPVASVVAGKEYRRPRARCGGEKRHIAPGRAAARSDAAYEDRNLPRARAARVAYEARLRRAVERHFPGFAISRLTTRVDLERSFGLIYARGLLRQGQTAFALLGVNASATQSSIDAALTFGILWLDVCRESSAGKFLVQGLVLFVPAGSSSLARERMANLNRAAAKWRLFEFDERHDSVIEMDCSDRGNIGTRLVHATNETAALDRFDESITRIQTILQNCEVAVPSPAELAFRWRGLEFARARMGAEAITFRSRQEIVFGVGAEERVLDDRNWALFVQLLTALRNARHPYGPRHDRLFGMHPERWLESLVRADVSAIDERLETESVYSQVPAFSAADWAMIDVLTLMRDGRLAVVELKADEDIHLPLQGLDYWARVQWHHGRGEFSRFGYFGGRLLSEDSPLLFLVAPALHVHPSTDIILRYICKRLNGPSSGLTSAGERAGESCFASGVLTMEEPRRGDNLWWRESSADLHSPLREFLSGSRNFHHVSPKTRDRMGHPFIESTPPVTVAHQRSAQCDTRCDRPPAAPPAESSARHPTGLSRADPSSDS
jgi:hypothetical protein